MLIDSHCHIPYNRTRATEWVTNAKNEGVGELITIGTSLHFSKVALIVSEWFENVFPTVAVYPHENRTKSVTDIEREIKKLLKSTNKFVAVGECGIDITPNGSGRKLEEQLELFEMQIRLALEYNLSIIVHTRDADELTVQTLQKYRTENLRGVIHCFSSSWEIAQRYLELNFYLSFGGRITYPSRKPLLETVKNVPIDRFLVETDAPYLPPQGHRGEKNEPKYVRIIAQKVGEVKDCPFDTICNHAYENTHKIFDLERPRRLTNTQ